MQLSKEYCTGTPNSIYYVGYTYILQVWVRTYVAAMYVIS